MTDLVGRQLGQYQLREVLRRGGMGTVYKAFQPSLDRWVAVKVLSQPDDETFLSRFRNEAYTIARLQHPNIVPTYDYGEADGQVYLVFSYVENGRSLADLVGSPMAPARALQLGAHLLAGLGYAHERGLVHRDVKPPNVLLPTPDWPMLADFGIAKLLLGSEQGLTQKGLVVGTAAYMAPEQAFAGTVDARSDLYATGVVLFELLCGQVPFDGDTPVAILIQQVRAPLPPPRSLNPSLPVPVERLLAKALEKEPDKRYQSAAEMSEAIGTVLGELAAAPASSDPARAAAAVRPVPVEPARPPKPKPEPAVAPEPSVRGREGLTEQLAVNYAAGVAAYSAGRWAEAVRHLQRVATSDPGFEDVEALLETAKAARVHAATSAPPAPAPPEVPEVAEAPKAAPARVPDRGQHASNGAAPALPATPGPGPRVAAAAPARGGAGLPPVARRRPAGFPPPPTPPAASLSAPVPAPAKTPAGGGAEPRQRGGWRRWPLAVVIAIIVAVGIGLAFAAFAKPPPKATTGTTRTGTAAGGATTASTPGTGTGTAAWAAVPPAPVAEESGGVAAFAGKLWVAGGIDAAHNPLGVVQEYDPARRTWSQGPALPAPVNHVALVSTGKQLLVIGGDRNSGANPVATVRRLDPAAGTWLDAPSLPAPRGAGAAAWDGHRIVFAGGVGPDGKPSPDVFALQAGTWKRIGTLPVAREHLAAASDGHGSTFFLGGETNLNNHKTVYNEVDVVQGSTVRRLGTLPTPRSSVAGFWSPTAGACVVGGRDTNQNTLTTVECVNPGGNVQRLPSLANPRHGLGAAVLGGTVYAVLGETGGQRVNVAEALRLPH